MIPGMKLKSVPLLATTLYLCALTYALVWVPWIETVPHYGDRYSFSVRAGYGLIWEGPSNPPRIGIYGPSPDVLSRPDVSLIVLRSAALTSAFAGLLSLVIALNGLLPQRFSLGIRKFAGAEMDRAHQS